MRPRSGQWKMADRLLNGRLADVLSEWHTAGLTWEEIARRLYAHHGVEITGQTLRRWAKALGIDGGKAA